MTSVGNLPSNLDAALSMAERTAAVDRAVGDAYKDLLAPAAPDGLALLAVGGYGRRHMFPYSDIDLLLLFPHERAEQERKDDIRAFLQRLWDEGLRMSHSVRTPAECMEVHGQNVELNISLLDRRFLTGDRALYAGMEDRVPRFLNANRDELVRNLAQLTRERHAKYAGTFYHLEPNVKETPGGLRDYQLLCWLEQLRGAAHADPSPGLREAFEHLSAIRLHLHNRFGRDQNILNFESQDALAEIWGSQDPAAWMRQYYRHARTVYRAAGRELEAVEGQSSALFAQFRDWRSRLGNAEISVHRERAHFRQQQILESDPEAAPRLFEFVARHGITPSLETSQRLEAQLPKLRPYYATPKPLWPSLNRIFTLPHAPLALRAMHETGFLCELFPELRAIECLVVRDFYHRYTVDEHTMVVVENLCRPEDPFGDLLAETQQLGSLVFSALFHDSGKGSGENHVAGSLRLAEAAMARIGMPRRDADDVLFLIRNHLELSMAVQSRDIYDPQTVRDVAATVGTVERLKGLALLTYADIAAVNPTAMTPWRSSQIWQLYLAVYNELTRELEAGRIQAAPSGPPERVAFLEGFPVRYARTHSDDEINEHMALVAKSRDCGAAVEVRKLDAAWQLTLAAQDRPGLFAAAAGALAGFGMNILRAEAFSNRRGIVLDTFTFADPLRNLELNPSEVDRLQAVAVRVLKGKMDVKDLLRSRPKPVTPSRKARIPGCVTFDQTASQTATLIEIVAQDRPGLLYDLASSISTHGANIEVVLIDTEAHKAIDVFYVTSSGRKLTPDKETALAIALRGVVS
jgi:[protein-PII] uridylyltransferase